MHAATEAKQFGQFRMGRGQMFAYGRNVWRSNQFVIEVDIDKLGASKYRLEEGSEFVEGCEITIDLHPRHELSGYALGRLLIDLQEQTCWVDPDKTEITLNGALVAKTLVADAGEADAVLPPSSAALPVGADVAKADAVLPAGDAAVTLSPTGDVGTVPSNPAAVKKLATPPKKRK